MGYVLYRGSRDELNEMCRVKDERIAELVAALMKTHDLVNDAQQNGFDPGMGDWLRPLQENQEAISAILR